MSDLNNDGNGKSLVPDSLKEELAKVQKITEGRFTPTEDEAGDEAVDVPEKTPEEVTPAPVVTPPKVEKDDEEDEQDSDDEEGDDDEGSDEDDEPKDRVNRKVIPIKRLHDEKRKREAVEAEKVELQKQLDELKKISNVTVEGSLKESDAIKALAEKHGYDEEATEDLVKIIRSGLTVDKETLIKTMFGEDADIETLKKVVESTKKQEMEQAFEIEYQDVVPEIKKQFPTVSPEQLQEVRKKLNEISHTTWGIDKDLDYILYKKKDVFEKLITSEPTGTDTTVTKKRPAPEGGRIGKGKPSELSAKDFTGKNPKSFEELANLSESEREKIVKDFDPMTRINYWKSLPSKSGDTIKRGGKLVAKI